MIASAQELSSTVLRTDVAIIGGGASGLTLASRLDREVIVIEGGALHPNPERDVNFAFETSGLPLNNISLRRRLVGGAGALWSGRCAPLDPVDFLAKPWAHHAGWPVSYAEIEPFLADALGVLDLPPVHIAVDRHVSRAGKALELENGLEPQMWQFVRSERHRGLHLGRLFIDVFEQERKSLLTESDAIRMVSDGNRVVAVVCRDRSGRDITVLANEFVLACGCVEASRFLLQNRADCAELLAPVDRWLGRGFQQHLLIDAGPVVTGFGKALRLQKLLNNFRWRNGEGYETGIRLCEEAIIKNKILAGSACIVYKDNGRFDFFNKSSKLISRLNGRENYYLRPKINVEFSIEQVVDQNNRISLGSRVDANGQRSALVHWAIDDLELRTARKMSEYFSRLLTRENLGHFAPLTANEAVRTRPMRDSLHHLGGTMMSDDTSGGVVDMNLKVHGTANLSIVGGSVFPSGGHANPTLTIMALALRLAERLNSITP